MLIFVAESGHTIEVECLSTTSVESIQRVLASLTNIPPSEQMLICGDMRLDPNQSLGSYKLPDEDQSVFLYNKSRLAGNEFPPPAFEEFETIEVILPKPIISGQFKHALEDALDPALKALPSYETEFKFHFQKGHAVFLASQRRLEVCGRLIQEQKVQEMAVSTAQRNMDLYYKHIDSAYNDFMKLFQRQHKKHTYLLANLDNNLSRLRACKLHPALRTGTRQVLIHFINEVQIRKVAEECGYSHTQYGNKVMELKTMYAELQQNVEALIYAQPPVNLQDLEETIDGHVGFAEEQASIIQSLSKDVSTVKKLVDDALRENENPGSLRPHDLVSGLGPMYEVHEKSHLPRLEACDWELQKLQEHCTESKNAMNVFVHKQLQLVASLQANIRNMRNQLALYRDALSHQDDLFRELKLVPRIGSAYKACLAEVVRRKAGAKLYMGQAGQMAEKLARKREVEVERREAFLHVQSAYIPTTVLRELGLFDMPSQCIVNIAPFDTNLLNLDVEDLERYAPESLVGPLLLGGVQTSSNRGSGTTTSGFSSQGALESEMGQDMGTTEDLQGLDDITGTSSLEVENAWLKCELAAAVAMLCNLDPDFELNEELDGEPDMVGPKEQRGVNLTAARKTADALRLKDDHAKQLNGIIAEKEILIESYEKRIRELEERLENRHLDQHRGSSNPDQKHNGRAERMLEESITSENTGPPELNRLQLSVGVSEPMDGVVSAIATECSVTDAVDTEAIAREKTEDANIGDSIGSELGGDSGTASGEKTTNANLEAKNDPSAMEEAKKSDAVMENGQATDSLTLSISEPHEALDATRPAAGEPQDQELEEAKGERAIQMLEEPLLDAEALISHQSGDAEEIHYKGLETLLKEAHEQAELLQSALASKTQECEKVSERLTAVLEEIAHLHADLESNGNLLNEAQLNCAHLENRLHEAREEARTNLCAANRRAAEYNALRTSSVRLRGLVERLKATVAGPPSSFLDSLRALAVSLLSSGDGGDEGEFRKVIRVLADRVGALAQQRGELLDRCKRAEASQLLLSKELGRLRL